MAELADNFAQQYGPWALIAGASEGIGECFARQLAAQGINLVLLSRSADKLSALAGSIEAEHSVETRVVAADLSGNEFMPAVQSKTDGLEIGLLIYNAGAVHGAGYFLDDPLEKSLGLVGLNCSGPVLLAHHFGAGMRERQRGGMIFLSSLAAYAGGSYIAAYAATKAFDIIFAQSLWHEMAQHNVNVLSLVAGATKTPAMAASGLDFESEASTLQAMESADVAREGLEQLANGPVWVAGEANRQVAEMLPMAPRRDVVESMSQSSAEMYGKPYIPASS